MERFYRNKKGSTLILVLMVFSILSMLGLAVLSLTVSTYEKRIVESKVKRNFYFSDGGIDVAYGVIGKVVDQAITDGNTAVNTFMNGLNLQEEKEKVLSTQDSSNPYISPYINSDGTVNEEAVKQKQNEVFQADYESYVTANIKNALQTASNYSDIGDASEIAVTLLTPDSNIIFDGSSNSLTLNVSSSFNQSGITKTIQSTYSVKVPPYGETYYLKTNKVSLPFNPVWSKGITVDGNMLAGNMTVNGDLFVLGTGGEDSGISVGGGSGSAALNVNGKVMTNAYLEAAAPESTISVNGNVYARDVTIKQGANTSSIYVNPSTKDTTQDGSVYTEHDLSLNAQNSHINIAGGFYGVNDGSSNPEPGYSSSIFINSPDIGTNGGSSLSVGKEVYIAGTAYVLTSGAKYQTGESVSIKGNYEAYTFPLSINEADIYSWNGTSRIGAVNKSLKADNIIFDYFNPLQMASRFISGDNLIVTDKSDYFKYYSDEYKSSSILDLGRAITFPADISKIHAIGAVVANNTIYSNTWENEDFITAEAQRTQYYNMVYGMGNEGANVDYTSNPQPKATSDQINYAGITNTDDENNDIIFLNGQGKSVALCASDYSGSVPDGVQKVNLPKGGGKGIIITNGDVYLYGTLDFTGTIICGGNLYANNDSSPKTVTYNDLYVKNLIASNPNIFNNVFINNSNDSTANVETSEEIQSDNTVGTDIARDKLIDRENWTLVK